MEKQPVNENLEIEENVVINRNIIVHYTLGDIFAATIFDGEIEKIKPIFRRDLGRLENARKGFIEYKLIHNYFDFQDQSTKDNLGVGLKGRCPEKYKWPEELIKLFGKNSLNIFYNCEFCTREEATDPKKRDESIALGIFMSYFEGGSGRITEEVSNVYCDNQIKILMLVKSSQDYINYRRYYHDGREYQMRNKNLFEKIMPETKDGK